MLTWHLIDNRPHCTFYTKPDFILTGRSYRTGGGLEFSLLNDTAVLFTSSQSLEEYVQLLIDHFKNFGLEIHVGKPGKDSKTEILFVHAPASTYAHPKTFDNCDLSNVQLSIVKKLCYLGSVLTHDCKDIVDVTNRITKASAAFGSVGSQLFSHRNVSCDQEIYL